MSPHGRTVVQVVGLEALAVLRHRLAKPKISRMKVELDEHASERQRSQQQRLQHDKPLVLRCAGWREGPPRLRAKRRAALLVVGGGGCEQPPKP
jgi:hypothetical protein